MSAIEYVVRLPDRQFDTYSELIGYVNSNLVSETARLESESPPNIEWKCKYKGWRGRRGIAYSMWPEKRIIN